jgi:hypothetical protein
MASSPSSNATPPFQFTLRQLLGAMAIIRIGAAAIYWLGAVLGIGARVNYRCALERLLPPLGLDYRVKVGGILVEPKREHRP